MIGIKIRAKVLIKDNWAVRVLVFQGNPNVYTTNPLLQTALIK